MSVPSSITDLSTTASSNSPAGSDAIGNTLDDYLRAIQAILRTESENKSWERWNDTPTQTASDTFTVVGDLTARYLVGRRVKCTDNGSTFYGTIASSTYSSVTTVVVTLDSGSLTSNLTEVQLGVEENSVPPISTASLIEDAINNGTTDKAPSENAVYDALALKQNLDDTLTALAGLATGSNKIPYSTGTDTFSQLDLSTSSSLGTSDTTLSTQKAVKSYVDNAIVAAGLTTIASGSCATGSPTSIDLTSIPQTYRALVLVVSNASFNNTATFRVKFNWTLGTPSFSQGFQISGTTVTNYTQSPFTEVSQVAANNSSLVLYIPAYQSGSIKQFVASTSLNNASANWASGTLGSSVGMLIHQSGSQAATEAITEINIGSQAGTATFDGGTYALYGVN